MFEPQITISRRTRITPYTHRLKSSGVKGYTVYNHMLLPTFFQDFQADYHHLKKYVQIWDVSCQRQIEIAGADATKLLQLTTPRLVEKYQIGSCYYTPIIDENGGLLNDPVCMKLEENKFWLSISDSDLILWLKGLVAGLNLNVQIAEADVYPLAVQGPRSIELVAEVFGSKIKDLKFFNFARFNFEKHNFFISRSGFSKQTGFEIYVKGWENGEKVWDALFAAGQRMNIRAGCPNLIERIEGGLLSYGNDITVENTPYECRMGKFCDSTAMKTCIGGDNLAMRKLKDKKQGIMGFKISGVAVPPCTKPWNIYLENQQVGKITSAIWSPKLNTNVAIGMIDHSCFELGTLVHIEIENSTRYAEVCDLPFTSSS